MALAHPCVFPIALGALVALFPLFGVYDGFMEFMKGPPVSTLEFTKGLRVVRKDIEFIQGP